MGAATARKRVSEYLDSLPLEEEQRTRTYRSLCRLTTDREVRMNQEKAREMAQAIINEVSKQIDKQKARVRTGVVPDLDRLTKAIQTYAVARYTTHPEVWPKGGYSYDYTEVVVDWTDQDWEVLVYRSSTVKTLWAEEKVLPIGDKGYLLRRTGEVELGEKTGL